MMFDTFYTVKYKGLYIHARYNRGLKREEFTVDGKEFYSLLSAKRYITRLLNGA